MHRVFVEVIRLKWVVRGGPRSNRTGVLVRRGHVDTDTQRTPWEVKAETGGRVYKAGSTKDAGKAQKLGEMWGRTLP